MPIMSTTNYLDYYSTYSAGINAPTDWFITVLFVQVFATTAIRESNPKTNLLFLQVFI